MSTKTAALIGATGMIGSYLLDALINDPDFDTVRVIVRRPFTKPHPKVEVKLVDFADYESLKLAIDGSDVVFSAIGTTQKNVKGDKELYRRIDYDIPAKAARICGETGCPEFVIVSSVGADSRSRNFYLKLKGELEDTLSNTASKNPAAVHIMQPSMLLGDRSEKRPAEKIIQSVMKGVSFLLMGSLRKYKPVHGRDIARAMIRVSKTPAKGVFRYTYNDILQLAGQ